MLRRVSCESHYRSVCVLAICVRFGAEPDNATRIERFDVRNQDVPFYRRPLTGLPPVSYYEHDVHDVNVTVLVEIVERIVACIPTLATPATGHLHNVINVHIPIAVEVTTEEADELGSVALRVGCRSCAVGTDKGCPFGEGPVAVGVGGGGSFIDPAFILIIGENLNRA